MGISFRPPGVVGRHGVAPGCFTEPRGVGLVAHADGGNGGNGGNGGSLLLVVAESRRLQAPYIPPCISPCISPLY